MIGVVSHRRGRADADRAVSAKIKQRKAPSRKDRNDNPRLHLRARNFTTATAFEAISYDGFTEYAAHGLGRIEYDVAHLGVAETAWSGDGFKWLVVVTGMDQSEYRIEANRAKSLANASGIVAGIHAKSPCASPSAASATRALSPRLNSANGSSPSREGRGVVSQTHAA